LPPLVAVDPCGILCNPTLRFHVRGCVIGQRLVDLQQAPSSTLSSPPTSPGPLTTPIEGQASFDDPPSDGPQSHGTPSQRAMLRELMLLYHARHTVPRRPISPPLSPQRISAVGQRRSALQALQLQYVHHLATPHPPASDEPPGRNL
jgi:hypothetical protein